jgi:hypothetical protein
MIQHKVAKNLTDEREMIRKVIILSSKPTETITHPFTYTTCDYDEMLRGEREHYDIQPGWNELILHGIAKPDEECHCYS